MQQSSACCSVYSERKFESFAELSVSSDIILLTVCLVTLGVTG